MLLVEASHAVRAARREAGLSQRGLALRTGVSARAIAAIESGQAQPSWGTVTRLLAAAGLEPSVERTLPTPCAHLERYLRLSTSERLYLSLGGTYQPRYDTRLPAWAQLGSLGQVRVPLMLQGISAVGVWVPGTRVEGPLSVWLRAEARPDLALDAVVLHLCASVPPTWVPVGIGYGARILVPPPEVLVLDPACAAHRVSLRAAARLLHEEEGRDDAERRAAAHRDPDESKERDRLVALKAYRVEASAQPSALTSRAWRLDGPVSLRQWMRDHGYPGVR